MKTDVHSWSHLAQFFLEWEMFQTKVEKIKTHFLFHFFSRKSYLLCNNVKKKLNRPHITIWRMLIDCMLDNWGYRHTLRISYSCFSTSTMVARTRLSVTTYLYCLSCDVSNSGACLSAIIDFRYSRQQVVTKRNRKLQQWAVCFNMHFSAHPLSRRRILQAASSLTASCFCILAVTDNVCFTICF